jgi:threonine aldolase
MIDLRSDTVTKPTPAMRRAMMEAEVGDDVYGEDPTVNRLEQRAAEIAGKEAALFVPTGTMGNTIAVKLHTNHGQEVICDSRAHVLDYELAMMAWFSGCVARAIPTEDGILTWEQVRRSIRPPHPHYAPTGLIEIENTHNMAGGTVYPLGVIREICDGAHERGLKVHMDGARVFNAAAAMNVQVREIVAPVDTVMFCLSKALGAPVGSMLAGPASMIAKGRLYRKRLGGGMRQAGVLAAAGLIALEETPQRLPEDHANARFLAEGLARVPGIQIDARKGGHQHRGFRRERHGPRQRRNQRAAEGARGADQRDQRAADARGDALRRHPCRLRTGAGGGSGGSGVMKVLGKLKHALPG